MARKCLKLWHLRAFVFFMQESVRGTINRIAKENPVLQCILKQNEFLVFMRCGFCSIGQVFDFVLSETLCAQDRLTRRPRRLLACADGRGYLG